MAIKKKSEGFSLSTMVSFIIAIIVLIVIIIIIIKMINPKLAPSPTCTKDYKGTCVKTSDACTQISPNNQALEGYGCSGDTPYCCVPPNALS